MKVGDYINNIKFLNFKEIIFCMILAFFILIFIKVFLFFKRFLIEGVYPIKKFKSVIKDFYTMFPKQNIMFRGQIYKRGMSIKVITLNKKVYEGEFVGFNGKNMICLITKDAIITNNIINIEDIILLDNKTL